MNKIILASGSPRRKEILTQVGISFDVMISDCEEITDKEIPEDIVCDLAVKKSTDIAKQICNNSIYKVSENDVLYIVGADTMVYKDNVVMGKPTDCSNAYELISMIQGASHNVCTGVAITTVINKNNKLIIDETYSFSQTSEVFVASMDESEINDYIKQSEWVDKAGGYAIQGYFAKYIEGINGDYYNIVGFPINRFVKEMKKLGGI